MRFLLSLLTTTCLAAQAPAPLRVCATTTDLGDIASAVGGDAVAVTTFVSGAQDPHFVEARPSLILQLSRADALVEVGLELEIGWLPLLVDNARNEKVLPGAPGRIDASTVIERLGVPVAGTDRSAGDIHGGGNPHYLADPRAGLRVAALLRDRFAALRPAAQATFAANFAAFRHRLCVLLVGAELAALYGDDAEQLATLFARGKLLPLLEAQGDREKLRGWCASMLPHRGAKVVADHDLWPYFAAAFGIEVVGFLEPKPGIAPTSAHLEALIVLMRRDHVPAILSVGYFAPQHAEFVHRATDARIAAMSHQVGSRDGCGDYLANVDHNVRVVAAALQVER
ncbi:MAG: zinc ABC transporter substrate-binding protein [Planctomycetes bacterium]|nr:zinc ABC transporter substrate-binding protein [Planctomycetota bacterium]